MIRHHTASWVQKISGYPVRAFAPVSIAAGKRVSIRVPVASANGWVNEVVVKQRSVANGGGTAVGYKVDLVDSCVVYHGADPSEDQVIANYDAALTAEPELFRVIAQGTIAAEAAYVFRATDFGAPFVNSDQPSQSQNYAWLYLCIIPDNAGTATTWEVRVTSSRQLN